MTRRRLLDVAIKGISAAVPQRTVEVADERFKRLTGIERRRVCQPELGLLDLARPATDTLLDELRWDRESVEAVVFVTQTPQMAVPSSACILHGQLGLAQQCAVFDVNQGCSGYVYGLSVAGGFINSENPRALLIVGETTGKEKELSYAPMFGDAVTATALEFEPGTLIPYELMTDGTGADVISERRLFGMPDVDLDGPYPDTHYTLKGEDVYQFSVREAVPAVRRMVEQSGVPVEELDAVVFHQANRMINRQLQKRLGLTDAQAPSTLAEFGNTSSATIPLTLHQRLGDKIASETGASVQLCGFGVGLSWATACLKLSGVTCPQLIEV